MDIKIADINSTVEAISKWHDINVDIGNTLFTVYADSSKAINEFESRLVAHIVGPDVEVVEFLNALVDFTDLRISLAPLVGTNQGGTWVARYSGLTFTDQD